MCIRSTDPTQEICATVVDHADCTGPTQLDHTRSGNRSALKDLDHKVGINDLSEV